MNHNWHDIWDGGWASLPFEEVNFDEAGAWSSSSAVLMYDRNENLGELAQFDNAFQALDQDILEYSRSTQQASPGIFGEGHGSGYEPLQFSDSATIPVEFPNIQSSSLSPAFTSPIAVPEAVLQPLLERIEALEAAQSVATQPEVQTPRSYSQDSSRGTRSPRAISRISNFKTSRLETYSCERAPDSDFRTDQLEQRPPGACQRLISASICPVIL
jgi:hypothetical protein